MTQAIAAASPDAVIAPPSGALPTCPADTATPPRPARLRGNPNLAPRCGAKARTTGCPCQAPAMANGRCRMHGGKSTGPRTQQGLADLAKAHTRHGKYTAAMRTSLRYQRALATRVRVAIAATLLRPHLPAELSARLADYPEELMPPPRPLSPSDAADHDRTPSNACHPAPVPATARAAQSRDARGRFLPPPPPTPSARQAEREAARQERAGLAPWRKAIKRARLIKRLLMYQAQNARRAERAQKFPPNPSPASGLDVGAHRPDETAADSSSSSLCRGAPLAQPERFENSGQDPIHRRTAARFGALGQDPIQPRTVTRPFHPPAATGNTPAKTPMQRGTVAHPAEPNAATGNAPVKTPLQRGTVAHPAEPGTATGNTSAKTPMNRGTVWLAANPFRAALLASTVSNPPDAQKPATQVERAGGWPILLATDTARRAGKDWRPAMATSRQHPAAATPPRRTPATTPFPSSPAVVGNPGRPGYHPHPTTKDTPPMPDGAATATEIIHVDDRTVACDGGDGALGHPRVFLHIEHESVMCPYCSRLYVLNEGAGHASGH